MSGGGSRRAASSSATWYESGSIGSVACLSGMLGEELPGRGGPRGGNGLRQAGAAAIASD